MKLPAAFVLFGLILVALSALADDNPSDLTPEEAAALQNLPENINRKPGIMENWKATANIFTLDENVSGEDTEN